MPIVPRRPRLSPAADALIAAGLVVAWAFHAFRTIFARFEWYDWVAYALPAANLVERGRLATPQLGSQFAFDKTWLFNAPLMALGPAPFFVAIGVGRVAYLVGLVFLAVLGFVAVVWAVRRSLGIERIAVAVGCSLAIVLHRVYLASYANQRYDLLGYSALMLAFLPTVDRDGRTPVLRWAAAGSLPLVHPSLIPASIFWLMVEIGLGLGGDRVPARPRWRVGLGPMLFVVCWSAAVAWYGRGTAFREQFLPHLRFHSAGMTQSRAGAIFQAASALPYSLPTLVTTLLIITVAMAMIVAFLATRGASSPIRVAAAAVPILGVVTLDATRGFSYWSFYVLGLAPACLAGIASSPRLRTKAIAAMLTLGAAQTLVAYRLDRAPMVLVDQAEAIAFLTASTDPGAMLVVGPPFVLASAPEVLPGGRRIVRVVPQPFFLQEFDRERYRAQIVRDASIYVGEREWFGRVASAGGLGSDAGPLFDAVEIREDHFFGHPVIIARKALAAK